MEKFDVLIWAIGGGFVGTWLVLGFICNTLGKIDEKLTDVDRRLCRLEGAFSSKECCMLYHHEQRKAE